MKDETRDRQTTRERLGVYHGIRERSLAAKVWAESGDVAARMDYREALRIARKMMAKTGRGFGGTVKQRADAIMRQQLPLNNQYPRGLAEMIAEVQPRPTWNGRRM